MKRGSKATVHNLRPHAAFDNEICVRPHVILNIRFGGYAGVCWSKTNARQENQSIRWIAIWMAMFLLLNSLQCLTFYYTFTHK